MPLPKECENCKLTGMGAINCPKFPTVDLGELSRAGKNCALDHYSAEVQETAGGKFVASAHQFNNPTGESMGCVQQAAKNGSSKGWRQEREIGKKGR